MNKKTNYLSFCVKFLEILNLWPNELDYIDSHWRKIKDMTLILSLMPCALPILADFILQLIDDQYNITTLTENLIALNCIIGMIYMTFCFVKHRRTIKKLVVNLAQFESYKSNLFEIDNKANLYAKLFIFYGIIGNIVYMLMPYLNIEACKNRKSQQIFDDRVPCGLVTRCRFPFTFDYTPVFEIIFLHQFYTCTMVTIVILVLTMLSCGLLMHIVNQLNHLRNYINAFRCDDKLKQQIFYCIRYHITIIEFAKKTNEAFSDMMMLHMTLTSLVISGLGFEIIMVDNFYDSLRFALHLFGWLILLFLVCYYGQVLIDESTIIAEEIYYFYKFEIPVKIQKNILFFLMRAQKPLVLSATNIGILSLPTYLRVIYSAYSYFTLLLNIK